MSLDAVLLFDAEAADGNVTIGEVLEGDDCVVEVVEPT